ncbi:MAG TPA: carbohydrate ABC transporter permease [Polaromonas sp.]|uniref:carbohydrate ABC transporter permease n=1 Tax=Polaromonas sp. TaxID=1869339 RepID=UPI002D67CAF5|nr:carbohydrate ABC transporter permease [Polaromonas sp.]HYW58128.1 carbohydrate ABC transporter permease [Polaromonas sp.]
MSRAAYRTKIILTIVGGAAASLTMFPIAWMLLVSLKTQREALTLPPALWFQPVFEAYSAVWTRAGFVPALINSVLVSCFTLVICIAVGLLAGYAISRYRFKGANAILFGLLMTRIFPPVALVTPYYLNMQWLGLQDSVFGLGMAYVAMNTPLAVWMLKGYFDSVPADLENCAMVDGATRWQAATRITLPLIAPGLAATSVFVFVGAWNEFLFALTLTSKSARTLPTVIAEFVGDTGIEWPQIMAASTIALAPVLLATFALQRHIAQGMTAGAIKG